MNGSSTVLSLLDSHAAADATAMIHCDARVGYRELANESKRVAQGLAACGVSAGDRVAIWLPTSPAWLACFFACARLGAIAVAVNTRFVARELADVVGRSGARVLVYRPGFPKVDFAAILSECASQLPALETVIAIGEADDAMRRCVAGRWQTLRYDTLPVVSGDGTEVSNAGPCLILTTSGTTKAPKFVLHGQTAIARHSLDVARDFGLDADSTVLLAPPLCGAFGFATAMAAIAAGRPVVTAPTWDPRQASLWIDRYSVTHLTASDDAIAQLLAENRRTPAFPSIRFAGYGSFNPAQDDIAARAEARGLKLVGLYGISEIQALFSRQDESAPLTQRALAGGRPVSGSAEVRVRDPDSELIQPPGKPGELEFLAPASRMLGYFGDPDATAAALVDGQWYRSGDFGYTLEDGRFVYEGRIVDSLRLNGFLVSALEIESVIQEHEAVDGCQVVGLDIYGLPRAVAFVRPRQGFPADETQIIAHAAIRLARFKVPARVFFVDAFPVTEGTNATKVQKNKLREIARQLLR